MTDASGKAILIDFGASKQMRPDGGATTSTSLCYTPGFAPPEQVEQNMDKFGPWTDLFALGATLFNLLTGKRPPQGSDLSEAPDEAFAPLNNVSSNMQNYIRWLMQPVRNKRPQSVAQALKRLDTPPQQQTVARKSTAKVQQSGKNTETTVMAGKPTAKKGSSQKMTKILLAAAAIVGIGIAVVLMNMGKKKSLEDEVAYITHFRGLTTRLDTLAYTIGIAQTSGLEDYLSNNMNIGTDLDSKMSFSKGVLVGSSLSTASLETSETNDALNTGIQIGSQIKNQMLKGINNQIFGDDSTQTISLKVLMAGFLQAYMRDHIYGYPIYTTEEAQDKINVLMEEVKAEYLAQDKINVLMEEVKANYRTNFEAGEKFLEEKRREPDVHEVPNSGGVLYKVLEEGSGVNHPTTDSQVTVDYEGRLIDGVVFDSSYQRDERSTFKVNQVIQGWQTVLTYMKEGDCWEVYIPQDQAYGSRDMGTIKPYSVLVFKIKLYSFE